jgi:hypothetical protein
LGDSLKAEGLYVFSRILVFATISVAGILPAIRWRDALDTLAFLMLLIVFAANSRYNAMQSCKLNFSAFYTNNKIRGTVL